MAVVFFSGVCNVVKHGVTAECSCTAALLPCFRISSKALYSSPQSCGRGMGTSECPALRTHRYTARGVLALFLLSLSCWAICLLPGLWFWPGVAHHHLFLVLGINSLPTLKHASISFFSLKKRFLTPFKVTSKAYFSEKEEEGEPCACLCIARPRWTLRLLIPPSSGSSTQAAESVTIALDIIPFPPPLKLSLVFQVLHTFGSRSACQLQLNLWFADKLGAGRRGSWRESSSERAPGSPGTCTNMRSARLPHGYCGLWASRSLLCGAFFGEKRQVGTVRALLLVTPRSDSDRNSLPAQLNCAVSRNQASAGGRN